MIIFGYVLLLLGTVVACGNWYAPIASYRSKRNVSMVPLVGAALLGTGIYTVTSSVWWSLLAIPLDLGTLCLIFAVPAIIDSEWSTSRFNLVHEFHSTQDFQSISLRLYRNSTACFKLEFDPELAPSDNCATPISLGLAGKWEQCSNGFRIYNYGSGREMMLTSKGEAFISSESAIPDTSPTYSRMDGLAFVKT